MMTIIEKFVDGVSIIGSALVDPAYRIQPSRIALEQFLASLCTVSDGLVSCGRIAIRYSDLG